MARLAGLVGALLALCTALTAAPLDDAFRNPPGSAKPHVWWHWLNGNETREGITADLEAMKAVGIGGAQMFEVAPGIPEGKVKYMSPEWRALIHHAVSEADRLGLELCIHNCAGWSSSGGPWITPEYAMQMVTVSETKVTGPGHLSKALPQPPTRNDYYRDIAVFAFPTPPAEALGMLEANPKATASLPTADVSPALDGNPGTQVFLPLRGVGKSQYLQFEFPQPFTAQTLTFIPGGGKNGQQGELQVSDDGTTFRKVTSFGVPEAEITRAPVSVGFAPVSGRVYRLVFTRSATSSGVAFAELRLEGGFRIANWAAKAGYYRVDDPGPDTREVPATALVQPDKLIDLTNKMNAQGTLDWDAPAGDWTILRMGYTPTGKTNHPAPASGTGLECDKLSAEPADVHFAGMLGKITADLGPLAGKTLQHVLIDSYEVGCQNWTPKLRDEFKRRRGYDPLPFLPVLSGRVVGSLELSERFLRDFRRTLADLFADNYYGRLADLCHQHGLKLSAEPYGNGNFDCLQSGSKADIPMSEFWAGGGNDNQCAKLASSDAHVYGRKFVGAESFTAGPDEGRWLNHPYSLKALGDLIYCGGVNRFIFHRYAQQPWLGLAPGMTMGPFGFEFERTVTWWKQSPAWLQYLTRCQYLLQEGHFAADLCYLDTENAPSDLPARRGLRPEPPAGYDYDGCDAAAVLTRMTVQDGRIVLPDGMTYRVLVLPDRTTMTPALLRKVGELVRAGATIVGPKPQRSPSLQGYPECDREVQTLADELWGPCDGQTVTEHVVGKGAIIWGKPLAEVLAARGLAPDFQYAGVAKKANVVYIHRLIDGADVYFVSNQLRQSQTIDCTFRATGKLPELWHPESGKTEIAPIWHPANGLTTVTLNFDPAGSVFVVFRQPVGKADPIVALKHEGGVAAPPAPRTVPKIEIQKAIYGVLEAPPQDLVDVTTQLRKLVRNNTLSVRASNDLAGDPALNVVKELRVDYTVNGKPYQKTATENTTLSLPGAGEGPGTLEIRKAVYGLPGEDVTPQQPTFDVTAKLVALIGPNGLSVVADNTLAGDPAPMVLKQMRVEYTLDGKPYTRVIGENQTLEIPEGTENEGEAVRLPPGLTVAADGAATLTAWEPGPYEAKTSAGRTLRADVSEVPAAIPVTGPWSLSFPPKWGAPEHVTLPKLISWPDSHIEGVRYFSGTATYTKRFDVPAAALAPGNALTLDLGSVREIAEVRLNGRDLGIWWKPPFAADVTTILRPGRNDLEVRLTNLWPNRLIGDEQLPEDCEWGSGGELKAWPAWLLENKPRPSGRYTFATWKHYTKDSPLLPSGLLGPVQLRTGRVIKLTAN